MPEVPKIVHERLRAGGGAHPDPNLLAAFAEQALSASEREDVLQHLAQCGDCREALALSLPALEAAPVEAAVPAVSLRRAATARRQPWFAWHRLGWAGLAAGVVIAVGILVMQPGKQRKITEALQKPSVPVAQPVGTPEADKAASSSEVATTAGNRPPVTVPPAATRRDELKKFVTSAPAPKGPAGLENTLQASTGKKDLQPERAYEFSASPPGSATETVEVTGGEVALAPQAAQTADTLGRNEAAPVMRAKAARALDAPVALANAGVPGKQAGAKQESAQVSTEPRSMANEVQELAVPGANHEELPQSSQLPAQWAVRDDKVQRSLDSGAHWKTIFKPHHPLLCITAASTDVWAGGKEGSLFHSANSGVAWSQVRPSINGQNLTDDITRIDVHSATQVVLFTSKNESWITTNGGKTWVKK